MTSKRVLPWAIALAGCASLGPAARTPPPILAIVGATVFPAPDSEPIPDAVILIGADGKIAAVGPSAKTPVPPSVQRIEARGHFVTAGFWNCHVHLTPPLFPSGATAPAAALAAAVADLALRRGITTIVDLGSFLDSTLALRRRIDRGEFPGPTIYTAGPPIFAKDGLPIYARALFEELHFVPTQVTGPEDARAAARAVLDGGADLVKLFTGAPVGAGRVVTMDPGAIKAATEEAHRRGHQVFAHPQSLEGMKVAVENGVDVLAHLAPRAGVLPPSFTAELRAQKVAVVPTLTLFYDGLIQEGETPEDARAFQDRAVDQLRGLVTSSVEILFGTDVGYTHVTDTTEELLTMAKAGMTWRAILAAMTTAPAAHFKKDARLAPGLPADLVVLDSDPRADITVLARPAITIRHGAIVYRAP